MDQKEFERRVNQAVPPHLKESGASNEAVRLVGEEHKHLNQALVPETIMLAGQLHERYAQKKRSREEDGTAGGEGKIFTFASSPTDYLAGDLLIEKLAPWTADLREDGFDRDTPPFKTEEEAASWIEQTSKANLVPWREEGTRRKRAREEIVRLAKENSIEFVFKNTLLPYQKPGEDYVKDVPTVPRTYLYRLALQTKRVAQYTGLDQVALVVHVLTGLRLAAPRMRIGPSEHVLFLPGGEQLFSRWASVEFFAQDLTDKELRKAYSTVRSHVAGKGTERIGYRELTFWWLMKDMEAPPRHNKTAFWTEGLRRWKQLFPDVKPDTWQGVRSKYFYLQDRLERLSLL